MKLSHKRKFGHTAVRAARVLKVTESHAVSMEGLSEFASRSATAPWVFCEAGDLVIEVIKIRTGKVLGYSYLTGPAIQLINYNVSGVVDRIGSEPLRVKRIEIPRSNEVISEAKFGFNAISVFRFRAKTMEEARELPMKIMELWAADDSGIPEEINHLMGLIDVGKRIMSIHLQPPSHANNFAATPFQIELLWRMTK